ncbi:hypothetical protein [Enterococcus sp.]|uniref:hypothetical protein n=1 Tax=Enterococcus sp. TaxID=35783 RepID=UPI0039947712
MKRKSKRDYESILDFIKWAALWYSTIVIVAGFILVAIKILTMFVLWLNIIPTY